MDWNRAELVSLLEGLLGELRDGAPQGQELFELDSASSRRRSFLGRTEGQEYILYRIEGEGNKAVQIPILIKNSEGKMVNPSRIRGRLVDVSRHEQAFKNKAEQKVDLIFAGFKNPGLIESLRIGRNTYFFKSLMLHMESVSMEALRDQEVSIYFRPGTEGSTVFCGDIELDGVKVPVGDISASAFSALEVGGRLEALEASFFDKVKMANGAKTRQELNAELEEAVNNAGLEIQDVKKLIKDKFFRDSSKQLTDFQIPLLIKMISGSSH